MIQFVNINMNLPAVCSIVWFLVLFF